MTIYSNPHDSQGFWSNLSFNPRTVQAGLIPKFKNHVTMYSKLDEIGTLSKYINKLKDEMRDEKRNREEADTDYQNAVRKLEKGKVNV